VEVLDATGSGARFESPWPRAVLRFGVRYAHPRAGVDQAASILSARSGRTSCDARMPCSETSSTSSSTFIYENNSVVDAYNVTLEDVNLPGVLVPRPLADGCPTTGTTPSAFASAGACTS